MSSAEQTGKNFNTQPQNWDSSLVVSLYFGQLGSIIDKHMLKWPPNKQNNLAVSHIWYNCDQMKLCLQINICLCETFDNFQHQQQCRASTCVHVNEIQNMHSLPTHIKARYKYSTFTATIKMVVYQQLHLLPRTHGCLLFVS